MRGGAMTRSELVNRIEAVKKEYLNVKWSRVKTYRSRKDQLPELAKELSHLKSAPDYIDRHLLAALVEVATHLPKDSITCAVMEDLKHRADRGLQKYNTTLGENDHQNMLQHAYEEALDMAQYLKKEIITLNTIQDLVKKHPNDSELGMIIRNKYGKA